MRVVSRASARVIAGKMVVRRRASILLTILLDQDRYSCTFWLPA
jgi:hypothetical protein